MAFTTLMDSCEYRTLNGTDRPIDKVPAAVIKFLRILPGYK